jgi:hypothetical protein
MEGILWGTLPIGSSIIALLLMLMFPDKKRRLETIEFPQSTSDEPVLREAL